MFTDMFSMGATPSSPCLIFKFALEPDYSITFSPREVLRRQLKHRVSKLRRGKTQGVFSGASPTHPKLSTGNRNEDDDSAA